MRCTWLRKSKVDGRTENTEDRIQNTEYGQRAVRFPLSAVSRQLPAAAVCYSRSMLDTLSLQERYAPRSICYGCGPANAKGFRIRSFPAGDEVVTEWRAE